MDLSDQEQKWGELRGRPMICLQGDSLVLGYNQTVWFGLVAYSNRIVKVDEYKSDPEKWPELTLLEKGTRLHPESLNRLTSLEYSRFILNAEILDGPHAGNIVDLGWLIIDSPDGNVKLVPDLLKVCE